ncbi:unnamed protein product [Aphanomyces euteiches]
MTTVLFAGCSKSSSSTESTKPAGTEVPATAATAAPEASAKPVTLKYLTWNYVDTTKSTDAWIKDMKDKFNITIEMQNIPTSQYEAALKTKLAAKDLPDLMMTTEIKKGNIMANIQIDPNQFVDQSELKSIAEYLPATIQDRKATNDGKLYYVPVSTNTLGVIYNKKVFSDNGISIPTNLAEFTAASDKLKAANLIPIAAGFKDSWTTQIIPFIAYGQYINAKDMNTRVKLADGTLKYADIKDDMKKVLSVQQDWRDKGYFPKDYLGTDINVASAMVGTGKAGMLISGSWQYKAVQDADPNAQIGYFSLPLNAAGEKPVVPSSSESGIIIDANSKNLDAAKQAMDYFLSAENQSRLMMDLNGIPTNTKVKVNNSFISDVNAAIAAGDVQPDWWGIHYYQPVKSTFAPAKELQNLLANGLTIDQFIANYDKANAAK